VSSGLTNFKSIQQRVTAENVGRIDHPHLHPHLEGFHHHGESAPQVSEGIEQRLHRRRV